MSKRKIILLIGGIILFLTLATLFFFYDLEISKTLIGGNTFFLNRLLAAIGEFPIYLGPILFGLVFGFTLKNKTFAMLAHFVGLGGLYVGSIRLTKSTFETFFSSEIGMKQYILLSIVALLVYILLFLVFNKIDKDKLYSIRDIALIYLLVCASSFVLVEAGKLIWGRPRFRSLDSNYSEYSNFLTIHGFKNSSLGDEYRSFPSGHTNSAATIIVLSLLIPRITSKKWVKYLVSTLCIIYPIIVAISRICMGAHYASDVLFGFGISVTCLLITYSIFKKKGWLYARSNKC